MYVRTFYSVLCFSYIFLITCKYRFDACACHIKQRFNIIWLCEGLCIYIEEDSYAFVIDINPRLPPRTSLTETMCTHFPEMVCAWLSVFNFRLRLLVSFVVFGCCRYKRYLSCVRDKKHFSPLSEICQELKNQYHLFTGERERKICHYQPLTYRISHINFNRLWHHLL